MKKPDRACIVFDASAEIKKTCLSDNRLQGIDLLYNLVSVISKFQNGKYGIIGDVEKNVPSSFCRPKRR